MAQQKAEFHKDFQRRLLMISGEHLEETLLDDQPPKMVVEMVASPCACKVNVQPHGRFARRLELTQNEDMKLTMPVFEIFGVPMGWLPIAWIPIGARRSGVLAPIFQLRDGFWAVQPLYLTMGPLRYHASAGYVLNRGARFEGEMRWRPRRAGLAR